MWFHLLQKSLPAQEGSVTESSVMQTAKSFWGSGKGSTEGKAERDLVMGMANLSRIIIGKLSSGEGPSASWDLGWAWLWVWQCLVVGALLLLEHMARTAGGSLDTGAPDVVLVFLILLFCWGEEVVKMSQGALVRSSLGLRLKEHS